MNNCLYSNAILLPVIFNMLYLEVNAAEINSSNQVNFYENLGGLVMIYTGSNINAVLIEAHRNHADSYALESTILIEERELPRDTEDAVETKEWHQDLVELDRYDVMLDEIYRNHSIDNKYIFIINTADLALTVQETIRRIEIANNLTISGELNSEWESFNSGIDSMGLSGLDEGRSSLFMNELLYKHATSALLTPMHSAVIGVVIAVGVTNPITGAILGTTYLVLIAPRVDEFFYRPVIATHLLAYQAAESVEVSIDATNAELEKLYRTPQEDMVRFFMRYLLW